MKPIAWVVAAALSGPMAVSAQTSDGQTWLSLGLTGVYGQVDVPCEPSGRSGCSEQGYIGGYAGHFTQVSPSGTALRLRYVHLREATDGSRPSEFAALVGTRFGESRVHGLVGIGRLFNPDDDLSGHRTGLAWSMVVAGRDPTDAGFEFALHGTFASDVDYVGTSFALRFGDMD